MNNSSRTFTSAAFFQIIRWFRLHVINVPDRFNHLTRILLAKWPDCRPYNGAFAELIPHLTVANEVDASVLAEVESCLAAELPVACLASQARPYRE
jgi:hypothetical protein